MTKFVGAFVQMMAVVVLAAGCGSSGDPQSLIAKAQEFREKNNYKAAIIELKNVLQKDPNHREARYLLGVTYHDSRDYRLAEQELRRALELSYERSKVMPALARSMLMKGDFQKVLDEIALDKGASDAVQADILTLRARALIALKQNSNGRELLEQALTKQPEFPDALLELARLAAGDKKLDESARLIDRAIASAPKHVDAWLTKSDLARVNGDSAGASAASQKVLEIDPANTAARLNIASLHIDNNKLDEARKLIAQTRALAPESITAVHMQALLEFRARDFKAANDLIQQVLKVAPSYMPSVMLAGAILAELDSHEQAQAHLGRVLERAPGNLYARKLLILSLARSGQTRRAVEVLQPALQQAPDDSQLMMLAGEIYLHGGEFGKAAAYFDKAAKRDPKNVDARAKLGISRMALGDTDRAFADLESAVGIDSSKYQTDMVLVVSHLRRGNYDQALKAMESLEKKQPNSPVTFNMKAVIYAGKKDIPNARKNFERALELQPTFLEAATNLAKLDIQDKNPKGARDRLEIILDKDKSNVAALLALAELGPALGATQKERLDWLERARAANPQAVDLRLRLGRLYMQMGDIKNALEVAQKAQASSPENPELLDLLGAAQMMSGQSELALTTYRKLVKLQPKSSVALFRLAGAQVAAADHAAAVETLKQVLSLKPDFVDAQVALVPLEIRAKHYPEAMNIARQVQQQYAKAPMGYLLEGDVLMAEQRFPQAIKAYETAIGMTKNSTVLIKLHSAYAAAGKPDEGDARLAQWLKEFPDDMPIRLYAADSATRRGRNKEAIAHYEWLEKRQPDNVVVLNNLAWGYTQVRDGRALEIAERAFKLAADNPSVADTLGSLLIARGDVARGMELLEKAAKAAPTNAEIRYHLAQGWVKAGDKAKARGQLERALATNAKFSGHVEALDLLKQLRE